MFQHVESHRHDMKKIETVIYIKCKVVRKRNKQKIFLFTFHLPRIVSDDVSAEAIRDSGQMRMRQMKTVI